jgi:hypothetical protein
MGMVRLGMARRGIFGLSAGVLKWASVGCSRKRGQRVGRGPEGHGVARYGEAWQGRLSHLQSVLNAADCGLSAKAGRRFGATRHG